MASRIEDYALIGDCETGALVARDGSIDWLCWPRFDSAACFAALLGSRDNGHWQIAPRDPPRQVERRYRGDTLILETEFVCDSGRVRVIDFMPPRDGVCDLIRIVVGVAGTVAMRSALRVRFDYGEVVPWVTRLAPDTLRAVAGPDMVVLRTAAPLEGVDHVTVSDFDVSAGERVPFVLSYAASHLTPPAAVDAEAQLADTERFWTEWSEKCAGFGEQTSMVRRSLATLKALTYAPTGGIVAAVTTSVPERIGGSRNWDYRLCWIRDASFAIDLLVDVGYTAEAEAFRDWLMRAVAGSVDQLQVMYGLRGERRLPEIEVTSLPGYEGSKPVRIGNAASEQFQLDIYGELTDAMYKAVAAGARPHHEGYKVHLKLMEVLEKRWREPDSGIWEVRGEPQQFTYSKVMAWVAFDRAIKAAAIHRTLAAADDTVIPLERWCEQRDLVHREVCAKAWNPKLGAFTQAYGSDLLDASVLRMPLVGFLPATDPRVVSTARVIAADLGKGGFVRRYDAARADDGLDQDEGVFLACSFWLADNFILQGRIDEGRAMFARLVALCNDVGLLSEEYDPKMRRHLGNFPQAFSHVALVGTALRLQRAMAKTARPERT